MMNLSSSRAKALLPLPNKTQIYSENKKRYLEVESKKTDHSFEGYQLSFDDLRTLAAHYEKKFDIEIIVSVPISPNAVLDEVKNLALDSQKFIGYPYPASQNIPHIETLIIGHHNEIFNIVPHNLLESTHLLILARKYNLILYTSDIAKLMSPIKKLSPQVTSRECGSIGLAYLKEYLKNNAEQLNTYTLKIIYNFKDDHSRCFLLPSPQVLRYSQSMLYVKLIHAMVEEKNSEATINHKTNEYKIITLTGLLKNNAVIKTMNDKNLSQNELNIFCQTWLEAYQVMLKKKESMHAINSEGIEINAYLAYLAQKNLKKIAQKYLIIMSDNNFF